MKATGIGSTCIEDNSIRVVNIRVTTGAFIKVTDIGGTDSDVMVT